MAKYTIDEIRTAYAEDASDWVRELLKSQRFPYTYHHDYVRLRVRAGVSRGDVAVATRDRFPGEDEYIEEVVRGAFAYVLSEYAKGMLDDVLVEDDDTVRRLGVYRSMKAHADRCDVDGWSAHFAIHKEE